MKKWKGTEGKNWKRGYRLCGLAVLQRKKETEWMLKLRVVYQYGLNNRIEYKDQSKSGKECKDSIRKAFPSLPCVMQRDNTALSQNINGQTSLTNKFFISPFKHWLKHDLPHASNHIRVALSSIKKVHLKKINDHIQDFIGEHNNSEDIQ